MSETAIEVKNLKKFFKVYKKKEGLKHSFSSLFHRKYEEVKAVDDISFSIPKGEIVGFIGQNGAGKTTTLKVLSGLLFPTSGQVDVIGFNPWERKAELQKQFALVMGQKNQLWWDLPAIDTFALNKAIYEIPDDQYNNTIKKLSEMLSVTDVLNTQVRKLSLGQKMKCEIIAAVLHNPKILYLDEPTIGLDVVMQKTIRDFIKSYNQEFSATILLTSHYMEDVKELCSRAIIIDKGKKIFDGNLSEIIEKFTKKKILLLTFSKPVTKDQLIKFGEIAEFAEDGSAYTATLLVARGEATQVAGQLLNTLPVVDLNIEEVPIEQIIREFFQNKNSN